MPTLYTFKDCRIGDKNIIDEWLAKQPPRVRAKFYDDFKHFAITPKGSWPTIKTFMLMNQFTGIREFRAQIGKGKHYRLGAFEVGDEIVLCSGWTRMQSEAKQDAAKLRVLDLKARVEAGEVITVAHVP